MKKKFADLKSIFWVKMLDTVPYFMQALPPHIINKQKIFWDEPRPYTIIARPFRAKHKKIYLKIFYSDALYMDYLNIQHGSIHSCLNTVILR